MKRSIVFACFLALSVCVAAQSVRLEDSSDWWSINRADPGRPNPKASARELDASNFDIAGVTLGHGSSEAITGSLGAVTTVERGDASSGRSQLCYFSGQNDPVHLVFEFGEDESVVYLFSGGKAWNGDKYCVASPKVSRAISTASSLKLGMSRSEVEKVLGYPDATTANSVIYTREFQKKSRPAEFEVLRRDDPERLSDQEAHKKFDYYPVEQYVLAKFADSKLVYLAISISGEGD